jgi:hypothetical protein
MSRVLRAAGLAASFLLLACSDVLPPDGGSTGDFTVTVGSGTQPTYSWPGGPAFRIDVVPLSNPLVPVWGVASTSSSSSNINTGLRHGTVPAGAIELTDEERTLTSGQRYRVTVTLLNQQRASREFRP